MQKYIALLAGAALMASCKSSLAPIKADAITPTVVTQPTPHDTDDPCIWINPADASKSLVIGTDKDTEGGLYVYDLAGKIVGKSETLKRPNNVDLAYGLTIGGKKYDVVITTERERNMIRIFSIPDMKPLDNGGIPVFEGEAEQGPMGVAIYTRPQDKAIFAVVGRKSGPTGSYLWQYKISDSGNGYAAATVVRKFGSFSGKKEIEAIAVDNELGFIYYCDETVGIKKYIADPDAKNDNELVLFGTQGFVSDHEGIAIYKSSPKTGYILVSNQQANTFMVFPREGANGNTNNHPLLAEIPTSTIECDGADATSINLGGNFRNGMLVAMSNGMTFHYYDWNIIQKLIDAGYGLKK
ncbi:3-phytase [Flavobacterium akiainvivens]|uniref:3-phytase n=1 Tax=Flavobacterium akiainvivens TaxID=1202724 RepID=A0A0M8MBE7_9FLAO|nr:phytase [Flavobacterium akiainvivens]KOS06585.1 3-phytase [Flavobacterium akiainvivens]SFQ09903.1 3-phytase [Flavobacterium akiainvivens]